MKCLWAEIFVGHNFCGAEILWVLIGSLSYIMLSSQAQLILEAKWASFPEGRSAEKNAASYSKQPSAGNLSLPVIGEAQKILREIG